MTHTKGPWKWYKGEGNKHLELARADIPPGDDDSVLYHGANWAISKANARLIAQAPELLEALRSIREIAENCNLNISMAASKAIAKAEGR